MKTIAVFLLALGCSVLAMAQPVPIELYSHKLPDTVQVFKGPDGKVLADHSIIYIVRLGKSGKPSKPTAGGLGEGEVKINATQANPDGAMPGELSFTLTGADNDEYLMPSQAIKGEKFFIRAFASSDPKLPSGTWYAESKLIECPFMPATLDNIQIGEWKKIP